MFHRTAWMKGLIHEVADTEGHRIHVILYEWRDHRDKGVLSSLKLEQAQLAKLDERLDRIEELDHLDYQTTKGLIFPFRKHLKKLKIPGNVALRPILTLGPFDKASEITFLLVAKERDRKLAPPEPRAEELANQRLDDIRKDPLRRCRYERD